MLAMLFGASCAGKSTHADRLAALLPDVDVIDLDRLEPGLAIDRAWRRRATEAAIELALQGQEGGVDTILCGGVFGELLAAPSATCLEGIVACLLDCADEERVRRLRERGSGDLEPHPLWDHVAWGVWLRFHARDPQWFSGPIRGGNDDGWAWERWASWQTGDPRWSVVVHDTTDVPVDEAAQRLAEWFQAQQRRHVANELPLSGDWSG